MKKFCMVLSLAGVMAVPNLFASMSVTLMDNTSQYSYNDGGEFRAVGNPSLNSVINWSAYSTLTKGTVSFVTDGSSWGYTGLDGQDYFQTFCIETSEYFYPGTTYDVSISQKAMYGSQPSAGGDPISKGTAWLYSQFAAGTLVGLDALNNAVAYNYTYGTGRVDSAGALQQAIWWLEGENGGADPGNGNVFRNAVLSQFGDAATAKADANGAYNVRALNLGDPGTVQDQLVVVPEPTTMIAGALLLLPFGASTLRILRRNRAM